MPNCTSCGSPIPEGQGSSCSMCYGDPDHGKDGYYREYLERQYEEEHRRQQEIEQEQIDQMEQERNNTDANQG